MRLIVAWAGLLVLLGASACGQTPGGVFSSSVVPVAVGGASAAVGLGGAGLGGAASGSGGSSSGASGGSTSSGGVGPAGGAQVAQGGGPQKKSGGASSGGTAGLGGSAAAHTGGGLMGGAGGSAQAGAAGSSAIGPKVVINEIRGSAPDFVELFNAGDAPMDLSGYLVTDDTNGEVDLQNPFVFPANTRLQPGHFVVVLGIGDGDDAVNAGPLSANECEDAGAGCYQGIFAVSSGGENVFLLRPNASILQQVVYPADVSPTYGRRPNGSGVFSVTTQATPGASNL